MTTATRQTPPQHQTPSSDRGAESLTRMVLVATTVLLAAVVLGALTLAVGNPTFSPGELVEILLGGGERIDAITVLQIWLPRLVLGLIAGAALTSAGVLLQDSLRNALAGPELLGVSSGAALIVAATLILGLAVPFAVVLPLALAGALASGLVVVLAVRRSTDPVRVILVGAALSALLSAAVISLITLGGENEVGLIFTYLLGDLSARTWDHVGAVLPYVALGVPLSLAAARTLNLLRLGDDIAAGLGLWVVRARVLLLVLAAVLVAATVAVCGPVPWVALCAPHLARMLLRTGNSRRVLPLAVLLGATLLPAADLIARQAAAPLELPVGVFLTLLSSPLLLVLLGRRHLEATV